MNDIETLRKRALMRAQHRGIKEMDIILGRFATLSLPEMDRGSISLLERFMEINDQKSYQMILGNEPIPEEFDELVRNIRSSVDFKISD